MTTNHRINLILAGSVADLRQALSETQPTAMQARLDWLNRQTDAKRGIVQLATARWLGLDRLSHSDTTLVCRALAEGERRGLWRRLQSPGGRTTDLLLLEGVSDG